MDKGKIEIELRRATRGLQEARRERASVVGVRDDITSDGRTLDEDTARYFERRLAGIDANIAKLERRVQKARTALDA